MHAATERALEQLVNSITVIDEQIADLQRQREALDEARARVVLMDAQPPPPEPAAARRPRTRSGARAQKPMPASYEDLRDRTLQLLRTQGGEGMQHELYRQLGVRAEPYRNAATRMVDEGLIRKDARGSRARLILVDSNGS